MKKKDCPKCKGKGSYMYDENHGTICDLCCDHDKGWWLLKTHYGKNNGKMCCLTGCGKTITWKAFMKISEKNKMYILTSDKDEAHFTAFFRLNDAIEDKRHWKKQYKKVLDLGRNQLAWDAKPKRRKK